MKRILMLGGADIQISAIKKAVELGHYLITCDYLPDNPGHKFAHEYHNVSTTDREAVLQLARQLKIDGISAYASDPAAITAAYVSENLHLPGNSFSAVSSISDKYLFRKIQPACNIPAPICFMADGADSIIEKIQLFQNGGILKPGDTSGSKGVAKINKTLTNEYDKQEIERLYKEALDYSRLKKVIIEEYIPRVGALMSGDVFIQAGKIDFYCFGDVHFNTRINGLVPRSISLPASKPKEFFEKAIADLQKIINKLSISTGVFNIDIIENEFGEPVIIDIGARNGGNLFNDIILCHTGINLIEGCIFQAIGEQYKIDYSGSILGYYAHNVLHSEKDGVLKSIEFSDNIEKRIIYKSIIVKPGDKVHRFLNSSFRLGLILLKFDSFTEMHEILSHIEKHVKVHLEK